MIKTILVEDEIRGLNALKKLLAEYCPELKIIAECTNAQMAREKIELLEPQLVFLDISLPGKNSFDMLAEMENINFEIIFITAYNDYTLQAFRYSAIDYLMKPINEDLLVEAVKKAVKRISLNSVNNNINTLIHNLQKPYSQQDMKLCISSQKGFQVVELKNILYCEANNSYTNFHLQQKQMICSSKVIQEFEELLSDAGFVRIHKSYLVNLLHVKEYLRGEGGTVILSNGEQIEVSRRKKEFFLQNMKEFYKF
jgi:two-component system LytT family response regulator